ncbi:MAG: glycosyltransferase family protein [Chitinispirillaceae bacterium]|jgi:hypothetical protein|nr:glycosyltransferase family protein [Chitinispirillaceae bacterium]
MISVITYSRAPAPDSMQQRNVAKTVGAACDYQVIDGSKAGSRFADAYNWAAERTKGSIAVIIADDLYFMKHNWGAALEQKFAADPKLGVVGIAGTQYLRADSCSLTGAGRPFIKGRIAYHLPNNDFFIALYSQEKGDVDVVACDGSFLAIRLEVLKKTGFDGMTFPGSNFYDMDFCLRARTQGRVIVTSDILAKRMSLPVYDEEWRTAGAAFLAKHRGSLPASCAATAPDPANIIPSPVVDLTGKAPRETIC